jgi:hypothetical protein
VRRRDDRCWQNIGSQPAVLLAFIAPSGIEPFFERYAALPEDVRNLQSFRALAPAAGMTVLAAPLRVSHPTPEPAGSDRRGAVCTR